MLFSRYSGTVTTSALTTGSLKTLAFALIAPGKTARVKKFGVSFDGTTPGAEPVLVKAGVCTGTVPAGGATITGNKNAGYSATTGLTVKDDSTAITPEATLASSPYVTTVHGQMAADFPLDNGGTIIGNSGSGSVAAGDYFAIMCSVPTTSAPTNVHWFMEIEEF